MSGTENYTERMRAMEAPLPCADHSTPFHNLENAGVIYKQGEKSRVGINEGERSSRSEHHQCAAELWHGSTDLRPHGGPSRGPRRPSGTW